MSQHPSHPASGAGKDFLFLHMRDVPYFRALLRAVESRFYEDRQLPSPIYDVGCGDGHFASVTFERLIDVGLDPWHGPIHEAKDRRAYAGLVEADAGHAPFPDGYFASGFSNSVLEHIPQVDQVLAETARVLKPGAPFLFCVPNENFARNLSIARSLDKLGLGKLATAYRKAFNRISRHVHCDDPRTWAARLKAAGFEVEQHWNYFSASALAALEWGHYLGLPSVLAKMLFGRWILSGSRLNLSPVLSLLRPYYNEPVPDESGAYTFYVARRIRVVDARQPLDA